MSQFARQPLEEHHELWRERLTWVLRLGAAALGSYIAWEVAWGAVDLDGWTPFVERGSGRASLFTPAKRWAAVVCDLLFAGTLLVWAVARDLPDWLAAAGTAGAFGGYLFLVGFLFPLLGL